MRSPILIASVVLSAVVGIAAGIGAYTFVYAKGSSYLTDDPAACANCHIMNEQYDGWLKSSHRSVAVCNDCHTPEPLVAKYRTKARNGFWHSFYFTTGRFPDHFTITPHNRAVTEARCRGCHDALVFAIEGAHAGARDLSCLHCHREVGHP